MQDIKKTNFDIECLGKLKVVYNTDSFLNANLPLSKLKFMYPKDENVNSSFSKIK